MGTALRLFVRRLVLSVAFVGLIPAARALVVFGGATGHTTDPGQGLPFDNVGNSGVYLGAYDTGHWVITANHVGAGGITLDGVSYSSVAGSAQRIGTTDLLLYRIDVSGFGAPDLANLTISDSTPLAGAPVVMVGDGSGVMTWGTNVVDQYALYTLVTNGPQTIGLITTFSPITGESQGQGGDSGGAVFFQLPDQSWMLSGILSGIGTSSGTEFTASVAVAFYYTDIIAIVGNALAPIPEPATWALWSGGLMLFGAMTRRRSRG